MDSKRANLIRPFKPPQVFPQKNDGTFNKSSTSADSHRNGDTQKMSLPLLPKSQQVLNRQSSPPAPKPTRITKPDHTRKEQVRKNINAAKAKRVGNEANKKLAARITKRSKPPESEHLLVLELQGSAELHVQHHQEVIAPRLDEVHDKLLKRLELLRDEANGKIEACNKRMALLKRPLINQMYHVRGKENDSPIRIRFADQLQQYQAKTQDRIAHLRSLIKKHNQIGTKIEAVGEAADYRMQMNKLQREYATERAKIMSGLQSRREKLITEAQNFEQYHEERHAAKIKEGRKHLSLVFELFTNDDDDEPSQLD